MATIALDKNKINQMPGLIRDLKHAVSEYKSELFSLKRKTLSVNKSVCNLDDVISSIQASSQTQEQKVDSLDAFNRNSEKFISDVVCIDCDARDVIRNRKDDFYEKYSYLAPDCEKPKNEWKEFWKGVGDWCKEHWVMITTVLVVIAIAIVAVVTFGVAIAAIAAIAGIVSLVLCAADGICMLATGGKSISDVCQENGMGWLGQIFDGISVGCDIVSIAFPAGAAIKTMAKVGVKSFAKGSIKAMKLAFKETTEKLFKKGFKQGFKNFGKILFKTLIFDVDDFTKIGTNGKRAFSIIDPTPTTKIAKDIPLNSGGLNPDGTFKCWPENHGFISKDSITLEPGSRIDRFGYDSGDFVSPEGTSYKNRAVPPGTINKPYNAYDVVQPIDVQSGPIASWFNEPGGGLQFQLPDTIENLLSQGKIKIRNYAEIVGKGFTQFGGRQLKVSQIEVEKNYG